MQIFAKTWNFSLSTKKTIVLDVEPGDLVEDVKDKLRHKLEIGPLVNLQLRFCSIILNNGQSLLSCNVTREANIDVFVERDGQKELESEHNYAESSSTRELKVNDMEIKVSDNNEHCEHNETGSRKRKYEEEDMEKNENVSQNFSKDFGKLMAVKTSKEIELRANKFKEIHDENLIISEKISKLGMAHEKNAKEIKDGIEDVKLFRSTSLFTHDVAKQEKDMIDAKIKDLQEKSSQLGKIMSSEKRKIKEREDAHAIWKEGKEKENDNINKTIESLEKRRVMNINEREELYNTDFEFKKKSTIANETLVEFISKSIDEKLKDLECPICFVSAETPIFMCSSFHLICKDCLPSVRICPVCRLKYPNQPPRHRFAEKMDHEVKKLSRERQAILDAI